jgi:polyisoprenoid-binding protein YceI
VGLSMFPLVFLTLALPLTAVAQAPAQSAPTELPAGNYILDTTHASVVWRVSHLGLSNYTARFAGISATLNIDPKNPSNAQLIASVDPRNIRTDYPNAAEKDFDKKLAEDKEWFNAGKFPAITFTSHKVEMTGPTTARMVGDLTMLGVTPPLTLHATYNGGYLNKPFAPEGIAGIGFSATGTLKRSEWGFNTYVPAIGDEVQVQIEAEFHSAPQVQQPK